MPSSDSQPALPDGAAPETSPAHAPPDGTAPPAPREAGTFARKMRVGATVGVGSAIGLWLGDVVALYSQRAALTSARWFTGVGSALLVAVTTAIVVGAALGPLMAPSVERFTSQARAFRLALRDRRDDVSRSIAAHALTFVTLVPFTGFVVYRIALFIPAEFARAESIAAMSALSHLVIAACLALGWSSWTYFTRAIVDLVARSRWGRSVTDRPWGVPALLATVALLGGGWLVVKHWDVVRVLPWHEAALFPGLVFGALVGAYVSYSNVRWRTIVGSAIVGVALVLGGVAAAQLRPESASTRKLAFQESLAGRLGYAAWTVAFDFDRDGQLSMLGGGDCAPFDARRHTGAIDIPGNGIDEDCDGVDLKPLVYHPRPLQKVGQENLPRKPTIVLITVDGLAAHKLAAIGGGKPLMPNVEALAAKGALFTSCFAEGPSTRLSFPSIFTSRWDSQLRLEYAPVHPYPLAASEQQLQDVMDKAGYETEAVVSHEFFEVRRWPSITRGFQKVDTSPVSAGKDNAAQVTDAALKMLADPSERPQYLWVHYFDGHGPYGPVPGGAKDLKGDEAYYDAALGYIDREMGRLLTAIAARTDPTYIFFTADHGSLFGAIKGARPHNYGDDLSTAVLHVPLIVVGPGVKPERVDGLASTMDIFPTIADLLEVKPKAELEGESLWPEILAGKTNPNRVLFHEFYLGERFFQGKDALEQVSVRDAEWNLTLDRVHGSYQLFNYKKDYREQHDLSEDRASSGHGRKLRTMLSGFVEAFHRRTSGGSAVMPSASDER